MDIRPQGISLKFHKNIADISIEINARDLQTKFILSKINKQHGLTHAFEKSKPFL